MSDVTGYFSERADDYERFRPSYPEAAIRYLLAGLPEPTQVADIGCGTGISARLLAAAGAEVVGVEPNGPMRERALAAAGGPRYVEGTAEATGLADDSVDLVVCAQSFHWFDGEPALAEFRRILKPGGRLALMWNMRQDAVGFGKPYAAVVKRAKEHTRAGGRVVRNARVGDPAASELFTNQRTCPFPNDHVLTWDEVRGRSASASYFPERGALRDELFAALREGFDAYAVNGKVTLAQVTEVTLCDSLS